MPQLRPTRPARMLCLLAISWSIALGAEADPPPAPPASATLRRLADEPAWHALLHAERAFPYLRLRSKVDVPGFLLADAEGWSPEAELRATWEAFFGAHRDDATECRLPARGLWLRARLDPEGVLPPRPACSEYDPWRDTLGDVVPTLIYPEAFLGNAASMFGHTLIRFDPRRETGPGRRGAGGDPSSAPGEDLVGWTLDYTADAGDQRGLFYLLRGLAGGYPGRFGLHGYYEKVKLYGDWQNRDIWEYGLRATPEEVDLVLAHLWEIRDARFPYLFLTENCSYELVELLRVAWPELSRGGGLPPMVIPTDTVRTLTAGGDRVTDVAYRPSPVTQLAWRMGQLAASARGLVDALARGALEPDAAELRRLAAPERAAVLELAFDWLRYRVLEGEVGSEEARPRSRRLLLARSRVEDADAFAFEPVPTPPVSPVDGHGTAMLSLAGGLQDREPFVELRGRPALHDLDDAVGGYLPGAAIRLLDTRLRYFPALDRVRLEELTVVDVVSASPWQPPFRPLAWQFDLGLGTRLFSHPRRDGLDPEPVARGGVGFGLALGPTPHLRFTGLGTARIEAGSAIEGDLALGPGLVLAADYADPEVAFGVRFYGEVTAFGLPRAHVLRPAWKVGLTPRLRLARNHSLVADAHLERAYGNTFLETSLAWRIEF